MSKRIEDLVSEWIETARNLIAQKTQIPLIDSDDLDMDDALVNWWLTWGDDREVRAPIETALARNPDDVAARFVALNVYYRLCRIDNEVDFGEHQSDFPLNKRGIFDQLAILVRLRDSESCTELRSIQWEIVNACAIKDYERALSLSARLDGVLPRAEVHGAFGRLHFLMAFAHTWHPDEIPLATWDLAIGPEPDCLRWALLAEGFQRMRAEEKLTSDDMEHLHDAISACGKAIALDGHAVPCRLMLARSQAATGERTSAAQQYQWLREHWREVEKWSKEAVGAVMTDGFISTLFSDLHSCLVRAYEGAGELDKAIAAAEDWIARCPNQLGTYERLARLQQQKGNFFAAYESLRKEADRNPPVGEDPNISLALAIGGVTSGAGLDRLAEQIVAAHPHERDTVRSMLETYWMNFSKLSPDSKQRWVTGACLLNTKAEENAGLAAHCFAGVIERELREAIFERFKASTKGEVLAFGADERTNAFLLYLSDKAPITLGQMFTVLRQARRPLPGIVKAFSTWIAAEAPWLLARLEGVQADRISSLRNREVHFDPHIITTADAEVMNRDCRDLLAALFQRR